MRWIITIAKIYDYTILILSDDRIPLQIIPWSHLGILTVQFLFQSFQKECPKTHQYPFVRLSLSLTFCQHFSKFSQNSLGLCYFTKKKAFSRIILWALGACLHLLRFNCFHQSLSYCPFILLLHLFLLLFLSK